jgi:hypothetical protein
MANFISVLIVLVAIADGTLLSYLAVPRLGLRIRVAAGAVVGIAILAWLGFVSSLTFGLGKAAIGLTTGLLIAGLFGLWRRTGTARLREDVRAIRITPLPLAMDLAWTALLVWLLSRVMTFSPEGLRTAPANNFGDLPFHFSVITSFAYGDNLPPQNPIFAGMKFTYPFLIDFLTAFFIRLGADWPVAFFVENLPLAMGLVWLLEFFSFRLFGNAVAARLSPLIFLFNGGAGFLNFFHDLGQSTGGILSFLAHLPRAYTMNNELAFGTGQIPLRWGNVFTTLLLPQRSMLFGLPIAAMILTLWWMFIEEKKGNGNRGTEGRRDGEMEGKSDESPSVPLSLRPSVPLSLRPSQRLLATAGILAGLLPMLHAHGFFSVMIASAAMAMLFFSWDWIAFFVPAGLLAAPQALYLSGTQVRNKLFEPHFWWEAGDSNPLLFWGANAGIFLSLLVASLLIKRMTTGRQARFFLPFALWFIIPNVVLLAPWPWDNIKMLVYWALAATPFVAMVPAHLFTQRFITLRMLGAALLLGLLFSGALDVIRALSPVENVVLFNPPELEVAVLLREQTPPRAMILHAPIHNSVVALSGRRSVMGYPGHLWTHGIPYTDREADVKTAYQGGAGSAAEALARLNVDYIILGPRERDELTVDENFLTNLYPVIIDHAGYRVFKVR